MKQRANIVDIHIGNRVRRTRVFRNVGLTELAAAAQITIFELKAREDGRIRFAAFELAEVAKFLQVRPQFFFEGLTSTISATPTEPPLRVVASHASAARSGLETISGRQDSAPGPTSDPPAKSIGFQKVSEWAAGRK